MLPFVECIHYITNTFLCSARQTYILRDEDITWPSTFDPLYDLTPQEIFARLQSNIDRYDSMPKSEDKGQDKRMKDIAKCFKIVQALMVVLMFVFD
jgi:hypothetical protein